MSTEQSSILPDNPEASEDPRPDTCLSALSHLEQQVTEVFSPGGLLAQYLPGFEARESQLLMARQVAATLRLEPESLHPGAEPGNSLESGRLLLAEAGTGTGKTLAYLVPAVLSGRKVVVSTNTINLQEQILAKEIPFLCRYISPWLKAVCVKGRANYLCLYRWHQLLARGRQSRLFPSTLASDIQAEKETEMLLEWSGQTETGDRAELPELADHSLLWRSLNAASGHCPGSVCPDWSECFISRLRHRASRAHLLIVNHHLLFSDLALKRFGHAEVLPSYEAVIIDEAHHLEAVATRHFGIAFSNFQVGELARDLEDLLEERLRGEDRSSLLQKIRTLSTETELMSGLFPLEYGAQALMPFIRKSSAWLASSQGMQTAFSALETQLDRLSLNEDIWLSMLRRCRELREAFCKITGEENDSEQGQDNDTVRWYERREKSLLLNASPIEVAPSLREHLYQKVKAVVCTSATLRSGKGFTYVRQRLGMPDCCSEIALESPFDYQNGTLLYVPGNGFVSPGHPDFQRQTQEAMLKIVSCSKGRALLLFTSHGAMRQAAEFLRERLHYPLLTQGEAPRSRLLERFSRETNSVLLAVASFWEGVDVPGESLSCVVIDKLPFEVPSDPVIMARVEKIRQAGGNPFYDFQIPRAVLALRQGLGRLLRSAADRGVLAILDVRLYVKSYGRLFLRSLPPSPVSREVEDIKLFFREKR